MNYRIISSFHFFGISLFLFCILMNLWCFYSCWKLHFLHNIAIMLKVFLLEVCCRCFIGFILLSLMLYSHRLATLWELCSLCLHASNRSVPLCSYVHRVGRTARAGREGYAVTFVTDDDRSLLKAIVSIFNIYQWFQNCEIEDREL